MVYVDMAAVCVVLEHGQVSVTKVRPGQSDRVLPTLPELELVEIQSNLTLESRGLFR